MKNVLQCLLFLLPQFAFAQWADLSIQTPTALTAVHFKNDEEGFTCGGNKIFKTLNGGASWAISFQGADLMQLEDVYVLDNAVIMAVGIDFSTNKPLILRSDNGGSTWSPITTTSNSFLKAIFFVDDLIGFCAGSNGTVLSTNDGGLHWKTQTTGTTNNLQSIFFLDNLHGFAAGGSPDSPKLIRTTNGGETWTDATPGTTSYLQSIYFTNSQTGYVVGWNGGIFKTTDGGITWNTQNAVNMAGNLSVFFTDDQTGYIVGGASDLASIQKTTNGGSTWVEIGPNVPHGLISVYFPSKEVGYAVGSTGTIVKTTTSGTTGAIDILQANRSVTCSPNPVIDLLQVNAPSRIFTTVKVYNNGGNLIQTIEGDAEGLQIDFSAWPAGNYYVAFEGGNQRIIEKIVKI